MIGVDMSGHIMEVYSAESQQRERIKTVIHESADHASRIVADDLGTLMRKNSAAGRPTVLGLDAGSTPVRLCWELIRPRREEEAEFQACHNVQPR